VDFLLYWSSRMPFFLCREDNAHNRARSLSFKTSVYWNSSWIDLLHRDDRFVTGELRLTLCCNNDVFDCGFRRGPNFAENSNRDSLMAGIPELQHSYHFGNQLGTFTSVVLAHLLMLLKDAKNRLSELGALFLINALSHCHSRMPPGRWF